MTTHNHPRTLTLTRSFRATIHQRHTINLDDYTEDQADYLWRHLTGGGHGGLDSLDVDSLIMERSTEDELGEEWDWIDDPVYRIDARTISGPLHN